MKNQVHRLWGLTTRGLIAFLVLFAVVQRAHGQATALTYGDAVVTGWNNQPVSGNKQIQILLLKAINAGTVIKMTNHSFQGTSTANTASNAFLAGGISKWTADQAYPVGTLININNTGSICTSDIGTMGTISSGCNCGGPSGAVIAQNSSGGKIFLYSGGTSEGTGTDYGSSTNPSTFNGASVSIIAFQGTQSGYTTWVTTGANGFKTALPSDLNSYSVFHASNAIGGYYNGTRSFASVAAARTAIFSSANWTTTSGSGTVSIPTSAITFVTTPSFTGSTTLTNCSGVASSINSNLTITDASTTATETWSITSGPTNGTLSGFSATATANGGSLSPSGLTYTSTSGYSGSDAFTIQVSNGSNTASQTVNVTVNPQPNPGTITCLNSTGVPSVCATAFVANSTSGTSGGTWSSSNTAAGTINPSTGTMGGVLPATGVSAHTTTISYTVSNSCGTASAARVYTIYNLSDTGTLSGLLAICSGNTTSISSSTYTTPGTGPFMSVWTTSASGVATVSPTGTGTSTVGTVTGLTAGTARITFTITGCGTFRANRIVTISTTPAITGLTTVASGSTITLSNTATGGTWTSGNTALATVGSANGVVTGVTAGTVTISYTSVTGCTGTVTTNITVTGAPLAATQSQTNVTCNGGSDGTATVTASGGTPPYNYSWVPSGSGATATGLAAGSYSCTITDAASGSIVKTFTITEPPVVSLSGTASFCTTTTLTPSASGGTWSSGNTGVATVNSSGVVTGVIGGTAVISYVHTCSTATQTVTVNLPNPGTITGLQTVCVTAFIAHGTTGDAGGTWVSSNTAVGTINASTGTMGGVQPGPGTTTISYTVTNGCGTRTATIVNTVYALTDTGTLSGLLAICAGGTTTISSSSSTLPGTGPYNSQWTSSASAVASVGVPSLSVTSNVVTGLTAGTARITYTAAGCGTFRATRVVTVSPNSIASITGTTTVVAGSTTTLANATSGGSWSSTNTAVGTISASGVVTGVSAGTTIISYTVTNSCGTMAATTTVTVLSSFDATTSKTNVACFGTATGSATVTPTGGTPPYNYTWAPIGGSGATASGLPMGIYTVTITDDASGSIIKTINVTEPTAITSSVSSQTNVSCNGLSNGAATISASGGTPSYTYLWAPGGATAATATGLAAGTYTVTITDANNCIKTQTVNITEPSALSVSVSGQTNVACNGASTGSITVTASGGTTGFGSLPVGYMYSWTPSGGSAATASGLAQGTYTCTVTDAHGCTATTTATISQPSAITTSVSSQTNVNCNGTATGAATINAGGGTGTLHYAWAPLGGSAATASGLTAGVYTCTVTDDNSCVKTQTVNITQPTAISTYVSSQTNVACNGGSTGAATVSASGGTSMPTIVPVSYTYSWAPVGGNGATATGLAAGTYTCTVTDMNGCTKTQTVTISEPPVLTASIVSSSNVLCNGGSTGAATVSAGGGTPSYTYSWAPGGATTPAATGLSAGTYTATVTDANGCTKKQTVTITEPTAITSSVSAQTNVSCFGGNNGAATVSVSGGTPYAPPAIAPTAPYTYSWAPGGATTATASNLTAGTYTCTITDANGCTKTQTVTITQPPVISHSLASQTNALCNGTATGAATVSASGGTGTLHYSWAPSGGATATATGLVAGTYTCTITDDNGCTKTETATITEPTLVTAYASNNTPICYGFNLNLSGNGSGGTGSMTYAWSGPNSFSSTATEPVIAAATTAATGIYTLTVTDANGCSATTTTSATVNPLPATIGGNYNICIGQTTNLYDATAGGSWTSSDDATASVTSSGVVTGSILGTATITYTLPTGCIRTAEVSVNPYPVAIVVPSAICSGNTITVTDASAGGTWSSADNSIASINTYSGVVTSGPVAGSVTIYYTSDRACTVSSTVMNQMGAITGSNGTCIGLTTTLADQTTGGTWVSSNTTVATVGTSGIVSALVGGSTTITYSAAGCYRTQDMNMSTTPAPITGAGFVCEGNMLSLSDASTGGTWDCINAENVTLVSLSDGSATILGVVAGTANVTYSLSSTCKIMAGVTVNPLPATISGTLKACPGTTTTLADVTAGGTWSSGNTTVASIDPSTGVVSGLVAGTTVITYTLPTSCVRTAIVTINPLPAAIGGTLTACVGSTAQLTDATPAGLSWTSSNTSVVTVNITAGIMTGVSAGTALITYKVSTGCQITALVTVYPVPAAITGTLKFCNGLTTSLSTTSTGGAWSSNNAAIATVNSLGVVTGNAAGTTTITYTLGASCIKTAVVTVTPVPGAITGALSICQGSTGNLLNTGGGSWSSDNSSVATVLSVTGVVTGVAPGTANVTYSLGTGCLSTTVVTVNAAPAAITGNAGVCLGSTTTLASATTGGTWSSNNTAYATIGSTSGVVSGLATGTARITYTATTGCIATTIATVNALPMAITGTLGICSGFNTTLSNGTTGGSWSSNDPATASVGATGIVTGGTSGTTTITYTSAAGCYTTAVVTVTSLTGNTGTASVCAGYTTTLANATSGGTWTSSAATIATVGTNGVVTGVAAGNATITYGLAGGCKTVTPVTVNALPNNIVGTPAVCVASTVNLNNSTTGGVWSSNDGSIATVGTAGAVTGVAAGNTGITYTLPATGCYKAVTATVNPLPDPIAGAAAIGVGTTVTLTDGIAGGQWSSAATSIVSVGSASGVVTALNSGTATITYTLPTSCKITTVVTINGMPGAVTGSPKACIGTTTSLSSSTPGGVWSSSNMTVATVDASGVVTGLASGTSIISYVTGAGSYATAVITINTLPANITGTQAICAGSLNTLYDATTGGNSWVSSDPSVVTIGVLSGIITGVNAGTSTITYTLNSGCYTTTVVTINPIPAPIGGFLKPCSGATSSLSDTDPSGTWTSSNTTVATIGTSGVVAAIASGTSRITYTLPTGCVNTAVVTVNLAAATISGSPVACTGTTTTLTTSGGGTWASDNTSIATMSGAVVTGVALGTANVTFTATNGCASSVVVTINPVPGPSTGVAVICLGGTTTLSNALPGGTWTSGNPGIATVDPSTGIVNTLSSTGTVNITYSFSSVGCRSVKQLTLNPLPGAISGTLTVCAGSATTLSSSTGGVWSSTNTAVGTIGSISTVSARVAGIAAGVTTISYVLPTGCSRSANVTVNPSPDAGTISSTNGFALRTVSSPTSTTFSTSGDAGGTWTSSAATKASVGAATGLVTAVAAGTANITYSVTSGGCTATTFHVITVTAGRDAAGSNTTATQAPTEISIYPNPTKGTINISTADAGSFSIYAIDGKEIGTYPVAAGTTAISLPSGIAAGVYLCRYTGDNGNTATVRIVYEQ